MEPSEAIATRVSRSRLFVAFSQIALSGFGGIVFWARRILVDRNGWISEKQFVELLTLGQLIPGPPGLNLTVMVGHRFGGWTGAAAAVGGLMLWPCLAVVGLGIAYRHYGALPQVQRALAGMSIVAAALLFSTFVKMAKVLPLRWRPWLFAALAFVGVGVLRWPLYWVVATLAPLALWCAWREEA